MIPRIPAIIISIIAAFILPMVALSAEQGPPMLKVAGNQLRTIQGAAVHLHGVNVPSLEWGQGEHLSESLDAATQWGANIIRLPLSQDRWFGHTREKEDGGVHYRQTVESFVANASAKNCYVILDLHRSDCGVWGQDMAQHEMPDANSVLFWESVSTMFANNPAVLFGLYNEPHDVSWEIWRNGGSVSETEKKEPQVKVEYVTPGMQKLLEVCRAKGAKNVAIAGGLDWAYDLRGVASGHALNDASGNGVVYDSHFYPMKKWFTHGDTKSQDWDRIVLSGGGKYPVLIGEFGDGKENYESKVIEFAKAHDLPWTAWCLHPGAKPNLIKDWNYTTTDYGAVVKEALQAASSR